MDLAGRIVEFVDSGSLRLGYVRRQDHRKIHVVDRRGRESTAPVSRVLTTHEPVEEADFPARAEAIAERIEARAADIDVELLWESVQDTARPFPVGELAEAYFGARAPELESAIFRRLDADPTFFRRSGMDFEPRSPDQVQAERVRAAREAERTRFRGQLYTLLKEAVAGRAPDLDPEWPHVLDRLERWLRHRDGNDVAEILERIAGATRAAEAAYEVLAAAGRIGPAEDRFLLVRGVPTVFPAEVLERARALAPYAPAAGREPRGDRIGPWTVSIDDEETVEVDDALSLTEDGPDAVVGIHIADVAAFVARDDALDREAFRRSATIYLPNVSVLMFPPPLATDLASLTAGEDRPAFSVEARFDAGDNLVDFTIARTMIRVTDRMTYEAADQALAAGHRSLARLHHIAERLRGERGRRGAQTHRRPEIKVRVEDGAISVRRIETDTPARNIVTEMMILANGLAADRAAAENIPILFRTQDRPAQPPPDTAGLPEAVRFDLLRRSFKRSRLSLSPGPHFGLGLTAYTQVSSPIRRHADLVTQRQFGAALAGQPPPYDPEELRRILTVAETAEVEIRRLEQTSTSYWILTYLSREKMGRPLEALVLDEKGTVELTEFLVRGRMQEANGLSPGDPVTVTLESVDPVRGEVQFLSA